MFLRSGLHPQTAASLVRYVDIAGFELFVTVDLMWTDSLRLAWRWWKPREPVKPVMTWR
jgi:hypothetical protein